MPRRKPVTNPPVRTPRPPRGAFVKGIASKIKRLTAPTKLRRK